MRRTLISAAGGAAALLVIAAILNAQHTGYDPALWSGMKYRMIGPFRGGRVTAVTGVPSQPCTFYMGSTGGGVWKTTDAGHTWTECFRWLFLGRIHGRDRGVGSPIPNVVYAGTGSSKIRSNVSIGRGMYKSTDAGRRGHSSACAMPGQISTMRVSPRIPTWFMWRRWEIRLCRIKSAAFIVPPTAARPGRKSSSDR